MSAFARYLGDKRISILPHLTASVWSQSLFVSQALKQDRRGLTWYTDRGEGERVERNC